MNKIWSWLWTLRLAGHRVDPAINIIYNTRNWHFVVEDGTHDFSHLTPDKHRLHLHTYPYGRIRKVTI